MMNMMLELIILIFSSVVNVLLAVLVLTKDSKRSVNRYFAFLAVAFVSWQVSNYISVHPILFDQLFWIRIVIMWATIMSMALLLLSNVFPLGTPYFKNLGKINTILGILVGTIAVSPWLFTHVDYSTGSAQPVPGPGIVLFAPYVIVTVLLSMFILARRFFILKGKDREYIRYAIIGIVLAYSLLILFNFILVLVFHNTSLILLSPAFGLIFTASFGYGMIRHHLFDIRLAAVRTLVYGAVLLTLAGIYYLLAYLFSRIVFQTGDADQSSVSSVNIAIALLLAFLFQPIKLFFDRMTDNIFYQDRYHSDEFFATLSELLATTTDLRGLLERASAVIGGTLKSEQTFFFLYYSNAIDHHMSAGTRHHSRLPIGDARTLDEYVLKHSEGLILAELLPEDDAIRRLLVSHKIALIMPIKHENHVMGYLCLGEQQSSGYTKRDLKVLATIADELVIAIQNALSVHEIKEINATLQQRVKAATKELRTSNAQLRHIDTAKDEFVSMASHQLRTPLTSVKGYLSMVIEGDAGTITDSQKYLLSEAFESSERMVRLINDFLSVSRLQTGRFVIEKRQIDIGKVAGQEVDSLRSIASAHGLRLSYRAPTKPQLIWCDEDKIRQVMMNFIDNAIYYSRTDSSIHIALGMIGSEVIFTVEDTGIGVPKAEQYRLFGKFFRASNARKQRPDGTGVGLFLTKQVIAEHGGKIIFSSREGEGSTFGFRLPVGKAPEPEPELAAGGETDNLNDHHEDNKAN